MNPIERAIQFECNGERLLGIVSEPPNAARATGVVIVVGGPQYRAGSHRQFVTLARSLAGAGYAVLRFDTRGMGDSEGAQRGFEQINEDIGAAIDALQAACQGVKRVVLWGLCDGGSAALLYLYERPDARVVGLALLNPWVRSEASLARTQVKHYYRQRLMERSFWVKLFSGQVAFGALRSLARNVGAALGGVKTAGEVRFQDRMAVAWASFGQPILLMLSERDYTAREFEEYAVADDRWRRLLANRPPSRIDLHGADHTCSQPMAQRAAEDATLDWLRALTKGTRN